MRQNLSEAYREASQIVNSIQIPFKERVKPAQSLVALKSIGKISFQKKAIEDYLRLLPGATRATKQYQNQIPQSVRLLDFYSQKAGFKPMGQVTDKIGNKYIGRRQQTTSDGKTYVRQFPKLNQTALNSPDLFENFTSYANIAINKWNQFVQAEAKLGNYIHKISTPEGRQNQSKRNAKLCSVGSRWFQMMSSLGVLYLSQRSTNRNFLQFPTQDMVQAFKRILARYGNLRQCVQIVLDFIFNNAPLKSQMFIQKFLNERRELLEIKLGDKFRLIEQDVNSQIAFVPEEIYSIPKKQEVGWIKYFNRNTRDIQNLGLVQIQEWNFYDDNYKFFNFF